MMMAAFIIFAQLCRAYATRGSEVGFVRSASWLSFAPVRAEVSLDVAMAFACTLAVIVFTCGVAVGWQLRSYGPKAAAARQHSPGRLPANGGRLPAGGGRLLAGDDRLPAK